MPDWELRFASKQVIIFGMSKTKLALLVFSLTFGINGLAFFFSHKALMIEEVKNVWMYELPLTASPVDAYVSLDSGPHQGVVGTLFRPNHSEGEHPLQNLLADHWTWNNQERVLTINLKSNLHYGNGDAILPEHFIKAHEFLVTKLVGFDDHTHFGILKNSIFTQSSDGLKIKLEKLPNDFDLELFLKEALTHPLSGVIHPKNLEALKAGLPLGKDWITSGPYFISKWTAKEIELVSRNDFPVGMQKEFLRTLKFQSAPVKNPSCDFLQGRIGDERSLNEHKSVNSISRVSILWACRSYQQNAFCQDPRNRHALSEVLSQAKGAVSPVLAGKTLRYRIPFGSDGFRMAIRERLSEVMSASGGKTEETSYFFKGSKDTDLELLFLVAPETTDPGHFAMSLASLSTRLGPNAMHEPNLVGLIESFPLQTLMKNKKGEIYSKVFLEPDLDEKKLPL